MSNMVFIETVEVRRTYEENTKFEVRVYDDYGFGWDVIPTEDSEVLLEDDLSILQYCINYGSDMNGEVVGVIDHVIENEWGIRINGTLYEWDDIKHLFEEEV